MCYDTENSKGGGLMKIIKKSANNEEKAKALEKNEKVQKEPAKGAIIAKNIWHGFAVVGSWIYKLRSVVLAIPVVAAAFLLAKENMEKLPEYVGINMQTTGEFAMMIERNVAVFVPLIITAGCLLMMFISRKVLYPWLISLFSLVLPLLLWFTNVFPA